MKLWQVSESTAKREMRRLLQDGFLDVLYEARRGRVGTYRLGHLKISELTQEVWTDVGPDFEERMTKGKENDERNTNGHDVDQQREGDPGPPPRKMSKWHELLQKMDPICFKSWFEPTEPNFNGSIVHVSCPSAYHSSYLEIHHSRTFNKVAREIWPECKMVAFRHEPPGP